MMILASTLSNYFDEKIVLLIHFFLDVAFLIMAYVVLAIHFVISALLRTISLRYKLEEFIDNQLHDNDVSAKSKKRIRIINFIEKYGFIVEFFISLLMFFLFYLQIRCLAVEFDNDIQLILSNIKF